MGNFREETPANLGAATAEADPAADLFSAQYVFGSRVYPIEQDPGPSNVGDAAPLSAQEAPLDLTLPADQEPTPTALGGPAPANANERWFPWPSGVSTLVVSLPNGADVRSLWFPVVSFPVQVSAGQSPGATMYALTTAGGELVPVPAGARSVALTTAAQTWAPLWVLASGIIFAPNKSPANAIVTGAAIGAYDDIVLADPTLLNFWPLNDPAGTTLCADYGPAPNPLQALGAVSLGNSGLIGDGETCAYSPAGSSDRLAPLSTVNIGRVAQTLEMWVFLNGTNGVIVDAGNQALTLFVNGSSNLVVWYGFSVVTTAVALPTGATYYIALTINNSVLDVYINGVLVWTGPYIANSAALTFLSYGNNSGHLSAKMEKVALYSGVYSLAQIRARFAAGLSAT